MGTSEFTITAYGKTPEEAFRTAVAEAQDEYGNRGYTGTIAEKDSFVIIKVPAGTDPRTYASKLLNFDDPRICDKYGPAGCIDLGKSKSVTILGKPKRVKTTRRPYRGVRKWKTQFLCDRRG